MQRYVRHGGRGLFVLSLLCIGLSGIGISYAITRDGLIADWVGISPLGTDPKGDAAAGLDLVSLYALKDTPNLSIRIDAVLARDVPANTAPMVNAGPAQTITLPASAALNGIVTDDGSCPDGASGPATAATRPSHPGAKCLHRRGQCEFRQCACSGDHRQLQRTRHLRAAPDRQ